MLSGVNSDTSHESTVRRFHNGSTNNGSEGQEMHVSELIRVAMASEVLSDADADVSNAPELHVTTSTRKMQLSEEIRANLDELQNILTNNKLNVIASQSSQLDNIGCNLVISIVVGNMF